VPRSYGKPKQEGKHLILVITAHIRRRKLLGVGTCIEGKAHLQAKTAIKMLSSLER